MLLRQECNALIPLIKNQSFPLQNQKQKNNIFAPFESALSAKQQLRQKCILISRKQSRRSRRSQVRHPATQIT